MHTLGPLNAPNQSEAVLRFPSQNMTLASSLKRLLIGWARSKDLMCKKTLGPRIFLTNSDTNCNRVKSGAKMSVFRSVSVCES